MAEGKKSVLLYCDLIHTIEKMDNETAGQFFKHYLRYINDLDPTTDNLLVDITFESVKQNLKRDLKKWENKAEKSRENGKLGGRPKKTETKKTQQVILKPKKPVTVNVTDTVNVNVTDILLKKETKNINIPELSEFFDYVKTIPEFASKFESLKFSIESKYESWIENGWKDGHGKKIVNWKSKLKNTLPHLKPINNFSNGTGTNNSGTSRAGATITQAQRQEYIIPE